MKNKIIMIVSIAFGLLYLNAGLNKLFNYMPMPKDIPENMLKVMAAMTEMKFLLPLVAVAEIVGGILFFFKKTRPLGAIITFPITVGILLTNLILVPSGIPMGVVLFLINGWIIYENREKYLPMING